MTIEQFNEILEQFESEGITKLTDAFTELEQTCIAAGNEAREASRAYFADAEAQTNAIQERIATLTKQCGVLQAKIESFKKPLVAATVKRDNAKLSDIKSRMTALEVEKRQISDEIEILQSATVTGAPELYNATVEKNTLFLEMQKAFLSAKRAMNEYAQDREAFYRRIKEETTTWRGSNGGYGPNMEKLYNHYNAEEQAKLSARHAAETAEHEAAERAQSRLIVPRTIYPSNASTDMDVVAYETPNGTEIV